MTDTRKVVINGNAYYAGIPINTEGTDNTPFDLDVVRDFAVNGENKEIRAFAQNILYFFEDNSAALQDRRAPTQHKAAKPNALVKHLKKTYASYDTDVFFIPTVMHCGDLIARAEQLTQLYPTKKIAALNPANSHYMGGAAYIGSKSLEGIMFTCSSLFYDAINYALHTAGFYYKLFKIDGNLHARPCYSRPMELAEAWFSHNVVFHKKPNSKNKSGYESLNQPFSIGIIWSSAPYYHSMSEAHSDSSSETRLKNEIRAQFTAAIQNEVDIPLITSFGTGEYHGDPFLVGQYYADILYDEQYIAFFDHVEVAIKPDENPNAPQQFQLFQEGFFKQRRKIFDDVAAELNDPIVLPNNIEVIDLQYLSTQSIDLSSLDIGTQSVLTKQTELNQQLLLTESKKIRNDINITKDKIKKDQLYRYSAPQFKTLAYIALSHLSQELKNTATEHNKHAEKAAAVDFLIEEIRNSLANESFHTVFNRLKDQVVPHTTIGGGTFIQVLGYHSQPISRGWNMFASSLCTPNPEEKATGRCDTLFLIEQFVAFSKGKAAVRDKDNAMLRNTIKQTL